MRNQFLLICIYISVLACGCSTHQASIEKRRQFAIYRVQHVDINSRSPVFREWGTNILSELSSATNVTLKKPQFASAAMGRDGDGEYRLYVFWLESKPSVDGVEVCWSPTNSLNIGVTPYYVKENKESSKVTIVMVASWVWPDTNSVANTLDQIGDVSKIEIRLLKKGEPVTGSYPVSFYRLDHWMGSKQITKITTGPSDLK